MGGSGSGNWYRWSTQTTIEETKRIDIRFMKKQGFLKPNITGSLSWICGGESSGDIRFITYQDELQLNYRCRVNGGEWQTVEQHIAFDRTPCNYGGERMWFLCPKCNRRVGVLCSESILFLCRHCCQISHASKQKGYMDNLINQKHKLGKRIFEHYEYGEGWGKKKGMHWKTFNRLHIRYRMLEHRWCYFVGLRL